MTQKEINELRARVYSISNSMFPLDAFLNDIEQVKNQNYNKEGAYNDLKLITDAIYELKEKLKEKEQVYTLEEVKKEWEALEYEWDEYDGKVIICNYCLVDKEEDEVEFILYLDDKTVQMINGCYVSFSFEVYQLLTKTFKALGWYDE